MMPVNQEDENGESYIPASQRPDGTWRKARRVKEGYVPQEEVPLYESKGKKFLNHRQTPAMSVVSTTEKGPVKIDGLMGHRSIPGLFVDINKDREKTTKIKKKKKKGKTTEEEIEDVSVGVEKIKLITSESATNISSTEALSTDPAKKLKNLKKRLREVEALELKMTAGGLSKPEPEQLAKIARKTDLLVQIDALEKQLLPPR